jgi:hypothetical protein
LYDEVGYAIKGNSDVNQYWFIGTDDNTSELCFATSDDLHYSEEEGDVKMCLTESGNLGIGVRPTVYPLHVTRGALAYDPGTRYYWYGPSIGKTVGWNSLISVKVDNGYIWSTYGFMYSSDKRIKENIIEIDDNLALKKVRDISCCWYNYKDTVLRGDEKVLGFIAQQVKEHLPEAVSTQKSIIPDKMKKIHTSWNETKMTSNDLQDVSGIKYRFYVNNDISGNEKMVDLVGDENDCFTFKKKWENVFCYGKEVDDFHTLDKSKLFALNFSATQELDRIQKRQLLDISGNAIAVKGNKNEIELLKLENEELTNRVSTLENEINSLKIIVGSLVNNN